VRCLRKDPDRRFQHMADLKVALEEPEGRVGFGKVDADAAYGAHRHRAQKPSTIQTLLLVTSPRMAR
jgi:hypothetical protein